MIDDMQIRNLSANTQASYLQQVSLFARYFAKSPHLLGPEHIRTYQLYLMNEKKAAPSSVHLAVGALRFLYKVTLKKRWTFEEIIPLPKKPKKLPVILNPEEVVHFLSCVDGRKHRVILTTCYAAGLRISEAVNLKPAAIDSRRMVIRVESGKNQKDRYVMLSPSCWLFCAAIGRRRVQKSGCSQAATEVSQLADPPLRSRARRPIESLGFPSRSLRTPSVTHSPCIYWNPARTSGRFNCCSVILVSGRRPGIFESPRTKSAPRRAR
jgi:site-specific recombinase XerC